MSRTMVRGASRIALGSALVALLGLSAPTAAHARSALPNSGIRMLPATTGAVTALEYAYATGRHIPAAAVGGVRPGSVHLVRDGATGMDWAVAGFVPAADASGPIKDSYQDGASRALFTDTADGGWRLDRTRGPLGCASGVPTAVEQALDLAPVNCAAATVRPSAAAVAAAARPDTLSSSIASIALGQVGIATTPAETSFSEVDCDPYSTMVGAASPNSDGCGADVTHSVENQNEEWCSDFSKWVWEQAGVTADLDTLDAAAGSFYAWGLAQGENPMADSGTAEPGDAVVFYPSGTITSSTSADHVGLISSVNSNGSLDMVNGDFLGSTGITVEYDQNLNLTTFATSTWGTGEQWVLVAPPTAAQQAAPTVSISAPTSAAAGTAVALNATASEPNGSISQYAWTFGDGRNNNATGAQASHVFTHAGLFTVTLTVTSNLGTVITKTWNVGVSAPSSAISSVQNNSVWYTTDPVMQYAFTETGSGALAVDSWDGEAWIQQTQPGQLASGSGLTSLTYAEPMSGYATVPHAFYRTSGGALGET